MTRPHVVVVGGGLAGLSAAIACADGGASVTLLEARPRLGGATWSFARKGLRFDNGQHVHLRCCTEYRAFLERIGTAHLAPIRGRLAIPVLEPRSPGEAKVAWIRRNGLPAPLHLGSSLLGYGHLAVPDRLRLLPAALGLRGLNLDDPALDERTFGDWLAAKGQSPAAAERLWDLITLPTTNLRSDEVSLTLAAKVFRTGLLTHTSAADIGWSMVPLSELHADPAERLLTGLGGRVERRTRVTSIEVGDGSGPESRATGVVVDGAVMAADAAVLAVPHEAAAGLVPAGALPGHEPAELLGLGTSPILNVHVVLDRRVMPYPLAAGVGSPVQFVFDRSEAAGLDPASGGQVLAVSVSGADAEAGDRPESLIDRYVRALSELFPAAREATVVDAVVTREHDATFRGVPGTRRLRPGPDTRIPNLFTAGAWTDTGWPATMESAVRSGNAAARLALRSIGHLRLPSPTRHEEVVA